MRSTGFISLIMLLLPAWSVSQYRTQPTADLRSLLQAPASVERAAGNLLGLDPSRLQIQQSYSMSYMSMGGQGVTQGVYLNTVSYQFSLPLSLSLQWGIAHQPFASRFQNSVLLNSGPFLSAAQLTYQPKPNMLLQFNFQQVPYAVPGRYGEGLWERW
ncbi:hypothetical protein GX408_04025 [bacterium]|nr:hypothetical protein [bacterium]